MSSPPRHIDSYEPVLSALRREGIDVVAVLRELGVDPVAPASRSPSSTRIVLALLQRAVQLRGDAFAARAAAALRLDSLGVLGLACLSAPCVGDALDRALRYRRLVFEADDYTLESGPTRVTLVRRRLAPELAREFPAGAYALVELGLLEHVVALRQIVGGDLEAGVELRLARRDLPAKQRAELERIADVPVHAGCARDELRLPPALLDRPTRHGHVAFAAFFDDVAREQLASAGLGSVAGRVREHLSRELAGAAPGATAVARALGMSPRTLTRHLAAEGTSFPRVLDEVRCENALRLLSRRDVSLSEIAFVLGFSEVRAFHRAFRRWTGQTPAEARRAS